MQIFHLLLLSHSNIFDEIIILKNLIQLDLNTICWFTNCCGELEQNFLKILIKKISIKNEWKHGQYFRLNPTSKINCKSNKRRRAGGEKWLEGWREAVQTVCAGVVNFLVIYSSF